MLDDEQARGLVVGKIREKFGVLRVQADLYTRDADGRLQLDHPSDTHSRLQQEINGLVDAASAQSALVCDRCGAPSSVRRIEGWVTTRCDSCLAERQAELERAAQREGISRLMLKHPRLFRSMPPAIVSSILPGWTVLVEDLFNEIDALLDNEQASRFEVGQIKEKFGTLRVHAAVRSPGQVDDDEEEHPELSDADASVNRAIFKLIEDAERRSASACSQCGCASNLRAVNDYMMTVCDACAAKRSPW